MIKRPRVVPSVSAAEIAPEIAKLSRRGLLRKGLSLGSLALLTGCDLSTHSGVDAALWAMLRFDDRVQADHPAHLHRRLESDRAVERGAVVPLSAPHRRGSAGALCRTCFDGYSTSIDMASALHPQTILAVDFEQQPLAPEWGAPVRLRIPVKLGFKSAKNLESIAVTNTYPGGFWEKQGYDWFSGV